MRIFITYVSFCLLLINISCNNQKYSNYTQTKENHPINDSISINKNKIFYSLLEENNNILIDTLYSIEIKDSILIDKLSMDWYLLKILFQELSIYT